MSFLKISAALSKHLAAFSHAQSVVHWDNAPITYRPNMRQSLIGASFLPNELKQQDFCVNLLATGLYSLNIYTPKDVGAGQGLGVADALIVHFLNVDLKVVCCDVPTLTRIGDVGDFFVENVNVPWHAQMGV